MAEDWFYLLDKNDLGALKELSASEPSNFLTPDPETYYNLCKEGQQVLGTNQFISTEQINRHATEHYRWTDTVCRRLDEHLHLKFPSIQDGFRPFTALKPQLKRTLDAARFRYIELCTFINEQSPEQRLTVVTRARQNFETPQPFNTGKRLPLLWSTDESIVAQLLEITSFQVSSSIEYRSHDPTDGISHRSLAPDGRQRIKRKLKRTVNTNRWTAFSEFGFEELSNGRRSDPVLVTEKGRYMKKFLHDLRTHVSTSVDWWLYLDESPVALSSGRSIPSTSVPTDQIEVAQSQLESMIHGSFDTETELPKPISTLVSRRLARFLSNQMNKMYDLYVRSLTYFDQRRPRCVVCGPNDRHSTQMVSQAATVKQVPVVILQHGGGYGCRQDPLNFRELEVCDYFLSFGDGITEKMNDYAAKHGFNSRAVTIGSPITDPRPPTETETQSGSSNETHALYVCDRFMRHNRYGPNAWHSDMAYLDHLLSVAEFLSQTDGITGVFKLHPKENVSNPLPSIIDNKFPDLDVSTESDFDRLVTKGDVILMDQPSTAFIELLSAEEYLIYLNPEWIELVTEFRSALKTSVPVVEMTGNWQSQLRTELETAKSANFRASHDTLLSRYANQTYSTAEFARYLS